MAFGFNICPVCNIMPCRCERGKIYQQNKIKELEKRVNRLEEILRDKLWEQEERRREEWRDN